MDLTIPLIEKERFKGNAAAVDLYITGIADVVRSGVINLLRQLGGRGYSIDGGENPNRGVFMAAYCEGYHRALDDLVYFNELHLKDTVGKKPITATFGALQLALKKGSVRKEDVDKLHGK